MPGVYGMRNKKMETLLARLFVRLCRWIEEENGSSPPSIIRLNSSWIIVNRHVYSRSQRTIVLSKTFKSINLSYICHTEII